MDIGCLMVWCWGSVGISDIVQATLCFHSPKGGAKGTSPCLPWAIPGFKGCRTGDPCVHQRSSVHTPVGQINCTKTKDKVVNLELHIHGTRSSLLKYVIITQKKTPARRLANDCISMCANNAVLVRANVPRSKVAPKRYIIIYNS